MGIGEKIRRVAKRIVGGGKEGEIITSAGKEDFWEKMNEKDMEKVVKNKVLAEAAIVEGLRSGVQHDNLAKTIEKYVNRYGVGSVLQHIAKYGHLAPDVAFSPLLEIHAREAMKRMSDDQLRQIIERTAKRDIRILAGREYMRRGFVPDVDNLEQIVADPDAAEMFLLSEHVEHIDENILKKLSKTIASLPEDRLGKLIDRMILWDLSKEKTIKAAVAALLEALKSPRPEIQKKIPDFYLKIKYFVKGKVAHGENVETFIKELFSAAGPIMANALLKTAMNHPEGIDEDLYKEAAWLTKEVIKHHNQNLVREYHGKNAGDYYDHLHRTLERLYDPHRLKNLSRSTRNEAKRQLMRIFEILPEKRPAELPDHVLRTIAKAGANVFREGVAEHVAKIAANLSPEKRSGFVTRYLQTLVNKYRDDLHRIEAVEHVYENLAKELGEKEAISLVKRALPANYIPKTEIQER